MSGLPAGWTEARLSELGDEIRGSLVPVEGTTYELWSVPAYPTGRPEVLGGSDIGSAKRPVETGDVLLCKINPRINRVWQVGQASGRPQIASTEYLALRAVEPTLSIFLVWFLRSPRFRDWIKLSVEGATGSHTRAKSGPILKQVVPLPPLNEQRRIVAAIEEHLSRLDAADISLVAAAQRLDAFRSGILESEFARDTPAVEIGSIATVGSGATPKRGRAEYWDKGTIPWVTSGQVNEQYVRAPAELITEAALSETNVKLWPPGTLLVALYGEGQTRGRCAELTLEATTNQACAAIVLNEDRADRVYVRRFFDARYLANRRLASGGVQPNLSLGLIRSLRIPLPPLAEQRRIVARVEAQLSAIDALRAAIERAQRRSASLRRAVLERAFRGELVPQDPTDEPAEALLARIRAKRAEAAPAASTKRARK